MRSVKQELPWNPRIIELSENFPYHFMPNPGFPQPTGGEILIGVIQIIVAVPLSGCVILDNFLIHSGNIY